MPCRPFDLGNGVTGFACTRGAQRTYCSSPGCTNYSEKLCDYPVTRAGVKGTCDAKPLSENAICCDCIYGVMIERNYREKIEAERNPS